MSVAFSFHLSEDFVNGYKTKKRHLVIEMQRETLSEKLHSYAHTQG
jgi:hypothetical protein